MVKDLRTKGAIALLGSITVFFICIYVIRFFFLKEGFDNPPIPTDTQAAFFVEVMYVPMIIGQITDPDADSQKIIREASAIGLDAARQLKPGEKDTIDYNSILNTIHNKFNQDKYVSTAYKVYKTVKFPKAAGVYFSPTRTQKQLQALHDEIMAGIIECIKKIHKVMPSYPFSTQAMDQLKAQPKLPTMDECKKVFKCSTVESIPANI